MPSRYKPKGKYKVKFVFKKNYETCDFICEVFVGRILLFTSKSYSAKEILKFHTSNMIEDLEKAGFEFIDVTNQKAGALPKYTETEQEEKYRKFKEDNNLL